MYRLWEGKWYIRHLRKGERMTVGWVSIRILPAVAIGLILILVRIVGVIIC